MLRKVIGNLGEDEFSAMHDSIALGELNYISQRFAHSGSVQIDYGGKAT